MAETIEEEQILYVVRRAIDPSLNKWLCIFKGIEFDAFKMRVVRHTDHIKMV